MLKATAVTYSQNPIDRTLPRPQIFLYDSEGNVTNDKSKTTFVLEVYKTKQLPFFYLFSGSRLLKIGIVETINAKNLTQCIFGDYIGFNMEGKIKEAQKVYDTYKLFVKYYDDGALEEYDSLVNNKAEGYRYTISQDGKNESIVMLSKGVPVKDYYTVISNDQERLYNMNIKSHRLYTSPVCYSEAIPNGKLSQTYIANGIRLTVSIGSLYGIRNFYDFNIDIKNTSVDEISFNPSLIKSFGGNGCKFPSDLVKQKVLTAENYALTLDKKDIVSMTRRYVQPTIIEPQHSYNAEVKVEANGSEWVAFIINIGGVCYPFYFTLNHNVSKEGINNAIINKDSSIGILSSADVNSSNRIFNDGIPFPRFDINKAKNLAQSVVIKLEGLMPGKKTIASQQSSTYKRLGKNTVVSTVFINKANTCINCINRLDKANNADQVYKACYTFYRTYKSLSVMRKSPEELKIFSNITQSFERLSNKVARKLHCSGTIMKARLDGLK